MRKIFGAKPIKKKGELIEEEKNESNDEINDLGEVEEAIKKYLRIVDELNGLGLWKSEFDELLKTEKDCIWNLHPSIFKEKENEWRLYMDIGVRVSFVRQDQAKKIDEICEKNNLLYHIDLHYPLLDKKPNFLEKFTIEVRSKKWKKYKFEDSFLGKLFVLLENNPPIINTALRLRKTLEEIEYSR